jgi:HPt (histidine-containing phosphotransfer) domain-containing protein
MIKPPLDLDDALPRVDGDLEFLSSLLDLFAEDFETRAAGLGAALERGDLAAAADLGHAIKGASANLGLPFLHAHALELEKTARANDSRAAKAAFSSLQKEYRRLREYLKSHPVQ